MKRNSVFCTSILSPCLCAVLFFSGCSKSIPAEGTAAFSDGTPLKVGTVCFTDGQHQYIGPMQVDGTFKLGGLKPGDGLPPGKYRVSIMDAYENDEPILDSKFDSPETSGISFDVVKGSAEPFKITVERSSGKRPIQ